MLPDGRNYWLRWLSVFFLISLGCSLLLGGLDQALRDRDPVMFFLGQWMGLAIFAVMPGVIVGGIIALASARPLLGGRVMIAVNVVVTAMIIAGAVLQARK